MQLEDRVLLSAAPLPAGVEAVPGPDAPPPLPSEFESNPPASACYEMGHSSDGSNDLPVVVWTSKQSGDDDTEARVFNSAATPQTNEMLVSIGDTPGDQHNQDVAVDSAGNSSGIPQGEFAVPTAPAGPADLSSVAMDDAGNFVVAWDEKQVDVSGTGIRLRGFDLAGIALSGDVLVNITTDQDQVAGTSLCNATNQNQRTELVFIDSAVQDYQQLVADLVSHSSAARQFDVVMLDATRDGIHQITETLAGHAALDAVHFVSHGSNRAVSLGGVWLQLDNLDTYSTAIATWSHALSDDGDLLFYGCDLAGGEAGRALIAAVSTITGADVAASVDDTGNAARGGDWILEFSTGVIATPIAFSHNVQQNWVGLLDPSPAGNEVLVNTTTAGVQQTSPQAPQAVAMDASGNFVAVWTSAGQDGGGQGVYAQRFDASGNPQGSEFRVNTTTANDQQNATVAMDASGNFVVTWSSNGQDGSGWGVYAQRYNAAGVAQAGEFRVNTTTASDQDYSTLAMNATGNFVVTWSSNGQDGNGWGVYAQRYNAAGVAQGGEFQVNNQSNNNQQYSTVAMDPTGNFVVTFSDEGGGGAWDVLAQRYNAAGVAQGSDFQVNTATAGNQMFSTVAMDGSGNFVATWSGMVTGGDWGVKGQRYNAAGVAQGAEFAINTYGGSDQIYSAIAMTSTGEFLVTWSSNGQDGSLNGIYGQHHTAAGVRDGSEFRVNTTTATAQAYSSVAMDSQGHAVIVWSGNGTGDSDGVFAQRYDTSGVGNSILVVDTTSDVADGTTTSIVNLLANRGADGFISLREALLAANNTANVGGPDVIRFNIAGAGVHTITLSSALPTMTDAVIIDGYSQTGSQQNTLTVGTDAVITIEIDGNSLNVAGLTLGAGSTGSSIRGLSIVNFDGGANGNGILVLSNNNTIAGNYIGLRADGTTALGNSGDGIQIDAASGNVIGGTAPADRNVISGSTAKDGVQIWNGAANNTVRNNYIGTDKSGTLDRGNFDDGVDIDTNADNNQIIGNIISGNNNDGIDVGDAGADSGGNIIQGNLIGTQADGLSALGNSAHGVQIGNGSTANNTTIGGTTAGQGNTIAFHGGDGVYVVASTGVSILGNSIYSNFRLAIDLGTNGVTANDVGDGDSGANNLQNYPVISSATVSGSDLILLGTLNSVASSSFNIDFFASTAADSSGFGEGQRYLGSLAVSTNGAGNATINTTLAGVGVSGGEFITATATHSSGNTSEFSAVRAAVSNAGPTISLPGPAVNYTENDPATVIDAGATVSDPDSPDFDGGVLTIDFTAGGASEDRLAIRNQGLGVGQVSLSGSDVQYNFGTGPVTIGTYTGGTGGSSPLVLTLNANADAAAVQAVVRNVTYQNISDDPFTASRTVRVTLLDGDGGSSNPATTTINVAAMNDAPLAANESYSTFLSLPLSVGAPGVLSNDSDLEGDSLTAVLVSGASVGSVVLNADGSFTYTPPLLYFGPDSFTYRAFDGVAFSNVATVTLNVGAGNSAPTATGDSYSVAEDGTLIVPIAGVLTNDSDPDGNTLFAALASGPTNGSLTLNANGSFTYTPTSNFNGVDSFTYRASDGSLSSGLATVTINVSAVNDAPVASSESYGVAEDGVLNVPAAGVLANDTDGDGDPLTAVLGTGPSNGSLTLNSDGSFLYTPTADFNGTDNFTYRANDGLSNSNLVTVTINIGAVNDAPAASNDSYSVAEDGVLNVAAAGVLANDGDVDGNPLAAILASGPTNGGLTLNADGSFTYTPNLNFNGSDSFTYRATDGSLGSNLATVTITVNAVNDVPAATNDSFSLAEDGVLNVPAAGVLTNDLDAEGDPLTALLISGPSNGSLVLNSDGSFSYAPNADFNGTDSFTYRASDGSTSSNLATVTITVSAVNDAPVALNETYGLTEDGVLNVPAAGVLANDGDIEGNPLTAVLVSGPASGVLTLNADGSFTYTPNADFSGTDSFTYRANDGSLNSNLATVTLTVAGVNDVPTATDDSYSVAEDGVLNLPAGGVLANDADVDGDPLTALLISGPTNGTLVLNADGSFTYTPNLDFNGTDGFTYRATDGVLLSNVASVVLTVTSVNDAPVNQVPGTQSTLAGSNIRFEAANGNPITIADADALASDVIEVTLTAAQGRVQMLPPNMGGITIVAGSNNSSTVTIQGTQSAINAALDELKFNVNSGATGLASLTIQTNDLGNTGGPPQTDTDVIDIILLPNAAPVLDLDGDDSSGAGGSDFTALFAAGSPPLAIVDGSDAFLADSDSPTLLSLTATLQNRPDGNNEILIADVAGTQISAVYSAGVLTLSGEDSLANYQQVLRSLQYQNLAAAPTAGARAISVVANDGNSDSNVATATIVVSYRPVAANDAYSVGEDGSLTLAANGVLANDVDGDGDPLTAVLISGPSNGVLVLNADGSFTYTPDPDFNGTDGFTYRAYDGALLSNLATVTITVNAVNDAPFAVGDNYSLSEDGVLNVPAAGVLANDGDVEGNPLTAVLASGPASGILTLNADGSFTYTPNANFNGTDSFTYRANDGSLNSNLATVTLTVAGVNDVPTATDDAYSVAEDGVLNVPAAGVLANDADVDGDSLAALLVSGPSNGSLTLNLDGSLTYTPNANFNGVDAFTYRATDGSVTSSVATVTITVSAVNDAPVASAEAFIFGPNSVLDVAAGGVLINDADVDGDALTAVLVTGPAHGQLTLNADGSFTYTPASGHAGIDTFTYLARDGASDSNLVTVTIRVGLAAPLPPPAPLPTDGGTSSSDETGPDGAEIPPQPVPTVATETGPVQPGPAPTTSEPPPHAGRPSASAAVSALGSRDVLAVVAAALPEVLSSFEPFTTMAQLIAPQARSLAPPGVASSLAAFDVGLLWNDLADLKQRLNDGGAIDYLAAGSAAGVSSALTVGYVLWTLRGGSLVVGLLAQMPAWRLVDPLVVLEYLDDDREKGKKRAEEEEDSLEELLSRPGEGSVRADDSTPPETSGLPVEVYE